MHLSRLVLSRAALGIALTLAFVPAACSAAEEPKKEPPPEGAAVAGAAEPRVHACAGAGQWFPADADRLGKLCDAYLTGEAVPIPQPPLALIVPHAGYQFSGEVAGRALRTLKGRTYGRVILMGPSHRAPVKGASVLRMDVYETPLGRIPVDAAARDALLACRIVGEQPAAHEAEHSVENQLPLLQRALGEFRMVEVLVGRVTDEERAALAEAVRALIDARTLLVASTDFTHYGPMYGYVPFRDRVPEQLVGLNNLAVQEILQVDVAGWGQFLARTRDTICGQDAVGLLLKVLEPMDDVQGLRVGLDMSGRQLGDYSNSVTYASIAFWRAGQGLTEAERETLLKIARRSVETFLKTGEPPNFDEKDYDLTAALKAPGAAFVTLKNKGELRGCIGHIVAHKPLFVSVVENAVNACRDQRFVTSPVTEKEAPDLTIEVSVLTPMRRLVDPAKVRVGTDGLVIVRGSEQGLLLPQVPVEQGWSREQFLQGTCRKAGLPLDAWKDSQTEIYRFSAQVFGEGPRATKE